MRTMPTAEERRLFSNYLSPLTPLPADYAERLPTVSLTGIETVLFDIYGTLLISDSGDIGTAAAIDGDREFIDRAASEFGAAFPPDLPVGALLREEIRNVHARARERGIPYPEVEIGAVWRRLLARPESGFAGDPAEAAPRLALLYELVRNRVWPMPGAAELLENLAGKVRIGIVSNAQFYTPLLLTFFFGDKADIFEKEISIWSFVEGRAKPDTVLFERALESISAPSRPDPASVLYIGNDMLNDVAAASRAGLRTLLFAGDRRSLRLREGDPRIAGIEPDGIVRGLGRVAAVIGKE